MLGLRLNRDGNAGSNALPLFVFLASAVWLEGCGRRDVAAPKDGDAVDVTSTRDHRDSTVPQSPALRPSVPQPTLRIFGELRRLQEDKLPFILSPDKTRAAEMFVEGNKWVLRVNGDEVESIDARPLASTSISVEDNWHLRPIFSPDSRRIYLLDRTERGDERVFYNGTYGPDGRLLSGVEFNLDSSSLVYMVRTKEGPRVVVNNQEVYLPEGLPEATIAGADLLFSPDGRRTAFELLTTEGMCAFWNNQTTDFFEVPLKNVVFSPDSARFAFSGRKDSEWEVVVDGNREAAFPNVTSIAFSPDSKQVAYVGYQGNEWFVGRDDDVRPLKIRGSIIHFQPWPPVFESIGYVHGLRFSTDAKHLMLCAHLGRANDDGPRLAICDDRVVAVGSDGCPDVAVVRNQALSFTEDILWTMDFADPEFDSKFRPEKRSDISRLVVSRSKSSFACVHSSADGRSLRVSMNGKPDTVSYKDVAGLTFNADGSRLGYVGGDQSAAHAVIDGQASRPFRTVGAITFSEDGRRVGYPARLLPTDIGDSPAYDRIVMVDEQPGEAFTDVSACTFSPDSEHYAYLAADGMDSCVVVDGRKFGGIPLGIRWLGPMGVEDGRTFVRLGYFPRSGQLARLEVPVAAQEFRGPSQVRIQGREEHDRGLEDRFAVTALESRGAFILADRDNGRVYKVGLNAIRLSEREATHLQKLSGLNELEISACEVTAEFCRSLVELQNLQKLTIRGSNLSDDDVAFIGLLTRLQDLSLRDNDGVSDVGLRYLNRLTHLHTLDLADTGISTSGVAHLQSMPNLKRLDLSFNGNQITDKIFLSLQSNGSSLEALDLTDNGITDAGLRHLVKLPALQEIGLDFTSVSDDGMEAVCQLNSLKGLSLSGTAVTDSGVEKLSKLTALRRLRLDETDISDGCFKYLSLLHGLRTLGLEDTQTSTEGLVALSHALPNCRVDCRWPISDLLKAGPLKDNAESDVEKLQGIWELVSIQKNGTAVQFEHKEWFVVSDDEIIIVNEKSGLAIEYKFRLEPNEDPKAILLKARLTPETKHYYSLKADVLTLFINSGHENGAVKVWRRFRPALR